MSEQDLLLEALQRSQGVDRDAYMQKACGDDAALGERVEKLLRAHLKSIESMKITGMYQSPPGEAGHAHPGYPSDEMVGTIVDGKYRLQQVLGEGGMGAVYLAEQTHPVVRKVAIKLIKAGMDSRQVLSRFEAERQALAVMDHPNIAKVLDAGLTPQGRPYFVMELVKGIPVTKYCDQEHLTPHERLKLFIPICQAVQHAHQKGIIHRDLKPSNVLVALYDGKPVPKVIDFGVAKAVHHKLTGRTVFTEVGQIVGTLEYMSPEQAEVNNLDIDTRTDVYSLGVILYELLTGSRPFDEKRLRAAAFTEMLRIIREEEPEKPSTKLSHSGERLPSISALRRTEPRKLSRLVSGDLDWIVMKALEKDRARRYETANGFAMDIHRYLAEEPVLAGPPGATYRLRKFLKRHRGPVTAAALLMSAVTVGGVVSTYLAVRAARAEATALAAAQAESEQRGRAEAVVALLVKSFRKPDPAIIGRDLKVVEILDQATADLTATPVMHPLTRAALQDALGQTYLGLGEAKTARGILQAGFTTRRGELGSEHPDTLTSQHHLAEAAWGEGDNPKAVEQFDQAYRSRRSTLGDLHPDTVTSLLGLASVYQTGPERYRAVKLVEECLPKCRAELGRDHPVTVACLENLAEGYRYAGEFVRAVPLFEECLAHREATRGSDHPETLQTANLLAYAYLDVGNDVKAVPLFERCLRVRRIRLGEDHPATLTTLEQLGVAYRNMGDDRRCVAAHEECLRRRRAKLGEDNPETLSSMNKLGTAYRFAGDFDKAIPLLEEAVRRQRAKGRAVNIDTVLALNELGSAYRELGDAPRSIPVLEESWQGYRELLTEDHPDTLIILGNLASSYKLNGDRERSITLMEERVRRATAKLGPDHIETLLAIVNLATAYQENGEVERAVQQLSPCVEKMRVQFGNGNTYTLVASMHLAAARIAHGETAAGFPALEESLNAIRAKLGEESRKTMTAANQLARASLAAGKSDVAIPLLFRTLKSQRGRDSMEHAETLELLASAYEGMNQLPEAAKLWTELLAARRKAPGAEHPQTVATLICFGQNHMKQRKHGEAELLLREVVATGNSKAPEAWTTSSAQALLGRCLLDQKKYAEAETRLLAGFAGMQRDQGKPRAFLLSTKVPCSASIPQTIDSLIQLYTETNKPDELKKWHAEKDSLKAGAAVPKSKKPE